jgi:hypothetical protein
MVVNIVVKKMFKNIKPVYESKTVWACVVCLILAILSVIGITDGKIIEVIIAVASIYGVYGRVVANSSLTI